MGAPVCHKRRDKSADHAQMKLHTSIQLPSGDVHTRKVLNMCVYSSDITSPNSLVNLDRWNPEAPEEIWDYPNNSKHPKNEFTIEYPNLAVNRRNTRTYILIPPNQLKIMLRLAGNPTQQAETYPKHHLMKHKTPAPQSQQSAADFQEMHA